MCRHRVASALRKIDVLGVATSVCLKIQQIFWRYLHLKAASRREPSHAITDAFRDVVEKPGPVTMPAVTCVVLLTRVTSAHSVQAVLGTSS
jgi:hypothetical protein